MSIIAILDECAYETFPSPIDQDNEEYDFCLDRPEYAFIQPPVKTCGSCAHSPMGDFGESICTLSGNIINTFSPGCTLHACGQMNLTGIPQEDEY